MKRKNEFLTIAAITVILSLMTLFSIWIGSVWMVAMSAILTILSAVVMISVWLDIPSLDSDGVVF